MENVAAAFLPTRAPVAWLGLRVISECRDLVTLVLTGAGLLKASGEGVWLRAGASSRPLALVHAFALVEGLSLGLAEAGPPRKDSASLS